MLTPTENFKRKAPVYMGRLMRDFGLTRLDAAAVFGNLGHESYGLTVLQEKSPAVKGSRGGYGWAQWTGPRRRQYENWCKANGLDPASDEANYGFLAFELKGPERAALRSLHGAVTLRDKVVSFEAGYERAGAKHYPSRLSWADAALAAYDAAMKPFEVPPSAPTPAPLPPTADIEPPRPPLSPDYDDLPKPTWLQVLLDLIAKLFRRRT